MRSHVALALVLTVALIGVTACGGDDPAGVEAVDLSGSWTLSVDGVCPGAISISQQGGAFDVSGSVGGGFCPFSAAGEGSGIVSGSAITFGIGFGTGSDQSGTGLGAVEFDGTIETGGNRMTGTYSGDNNLSGEWEAVRQ
jgi:hypothetical protein